MIIRTRGSGNPADPDGNVISLRCPACRQKGTFDALNTKDIHIAGLGDARTTYIAGLRSCPDPLCGGLIFFVRAHLGHVLLTYPPERIDFDSANIPVTVISALEEAITCHANQSMMAAAIMVRKTLEELCNDKSATGRNLKERIKDLGKKIVLPQELLEGLDDLRLLGNDAAHIESQVFNNVGSEEVEIGIEFTKEVLKATYQYSDLLSRLRGLKKSAS